MGLGRLFLFASFAWQNPSLEAMLGFWFFSASRIIAFADQMGPANQFINWGVNVPYH